MAYWEYMINDYNIWQFWDKAKLFSVVNPKCIPPSRIQCLLKLSNMIDVLNYLQMQVHNLPLIHNNISTFLQIQGNHAFLSLFALFEICGLIEHFHRFNHYFESVFSNK